nr:uncharacterized protein C16orf78-like [Ciona intestinalis]|eukprot:XP_002132057.1 uncharacterized protein C16orf78-like [Ciona intestinalis]
METNRAVSKRKQSLSWASLNPEQRNIFTANQLSVQNQKVIKDLNVIKKGIEDEKRCENAAHAKEEIMLQNRYNRISKASERIERRTRASLTYLNSSESPLYRRDSINDNVQNRSISGRKFRSETFEPNSSNKSLNENSSQQRRMSAAKSETGSRKSADKKKVRFDQSEVDGLADRPTEGKDFTKSRKLLDSPGRQSSTFSNEQIMDRSLNSTRGSTEDGVNKIGKAPSALDYYNMPLVAKLNRKSSIGFSHNAASFATPQQRNHLNHASGLEEEMHRWRKFHHNRALNARLKAVRLPGRRHHSTFTLREAMDFAARIRKDTAFRTQSFTSDRAWELLNCRYLRLTQNNVKTLEDVCQEGGYDVDFHPHVNDQTMELQAVFKDTRRPLDALQHRSIN